jgi:hypothetical protein
VRKLILYPLLFLLIFVISAFLRSGYESQSAFKKAEGIIASYGTKEALPELRQAIRWRTPFPFNAPADMAKEILFNCLESQDCEYKLEALRALREGISSSRSWLTINRDNLHLSELDKIEQEIIGERRVKLAFPPKYKPGIQILALIAFWGWIVSILFLIWRGFNAKGEANKKILFFSALSWIAFFILWLVMLRLA